MRNQYSTFKLPNLVALIALLFLFNTGTSQITLTKSGAPSSIKTGQTITYTIQLTNSSPDTIFNVNINDAAPAGTILAPGSLITWGYANIPNGQSRTVNMSVIVVGVQPGTIISNTAQANWTGGSTNSNLVSSIVIPEITSTPCVCLNDNTVGMINGGYSSILIISNADGSQLDGGQSYNVSSSSNLFLPDGMAEGVTGPAISGNFLYCNGAGCPAGVSAGQYYFPVHVGTTGTYNLNVTTPGSQTISYSQTNCNSYPALPTIPLSDVNCLNPGINSFASGGAVYSSNNSYGSPSLPEGFTQTGTGNLMIDNDGINEANNNPFHELYLTIDDGGCQTTSFKEFKVFKNLNPELEDKFIFCRSYAANDSIALATMLSVNNVGEGSFIIDGNTIIGDKYPVSNGLCKDVTYRLTDSCGVVKEDTKKLQITVVPNPSFDFAMGSPTSPVCSSMDVVVDLTKNSSGANPQWTVSPNTATISGNSVTFPAPAAAGQEIRYTVCLIETNDPPAMCGSIPIPNEVCADTVCKEYVVYRDVSDCGANALFGPTCVDYAPEYCQTFYKDGIRLICSFFEFITPPVLSSEVTMDKAVVGCSEQFVTGSYNVSFFGIMTEPTSGCKKVEDLPFISIVCDVLGFEIFGWKPLGSLYDALRCDKCLAEFFSAIIGKLAGGDGGGVIVMADTDGDGGFDYLIENRFGYPVNGTFSVPNRVKNGGKVAVRAVGGWVNSPATVCGTFDIGEVDILEKIPIGSIPIVGAIIEDILQVAGCKVNVALGTLDDGITTVINNSEPVFLNCNPEGYTFAQTLNCNIAADWSVPTVEDGCSGDELVYMGITSGVDVSNYGGGTPPTPVTITGAGIYQTAGPIPGSILEPGVYPVTYTAASCNGLPQTCTFNVVVTSGEPILECPDDITVATDIDACTSIVTGLAPYQGLGCSSIINYSFINPVSGTSVTTTSTGIGEHNIPDGYAFELGTTTITYTMQVDINGDGDYDDTDETQVCSFTVTVEDRQLPTAQCLDVEIKMDNMGMGTVYAAENNGEIYIDAGSSDNCSTNLTYLISRDATNYFPSLDFDCGDEGQNVINFSVTDESGNTSYCKSVVKVIDYFEGFVLNLDLPEVCFEPFQDTYDFSPYIAIVTPDGTNLSHTGVGSLGPDIFGGFGISAFLPDPGSTNDPGSISPDGVYTIGSGTGWITISYLLSIDEQINQIDGEPLEGCFVMVHDIFRIERLDPIWEGGFICCDQPLVWLGGATWDGTGDPPIPAGMISLTDIRGSYPGDVEGEWTGEGVTFQDPDGFPYTGDEFYQFDPSGLDASITLTYIIGDEPCIFTHSQEILVTCQDLAIAVSDTTLCPATWTEEFVIDMNLDDDDVVVSTTGLAAVGGVDLVDVPVVDGRVVIPEFQTVAVRNDTFLIGVDVFQTTPFGCVDYFEFNIIVLDTLAPVFQNCPKEPIIVEALPDLCENFVNFEDPWADDNCFSLYTKIEQVDTTGFLSNDLYPVGTTILAYTATDTVGNQSYCEVKIIVDDYLQFPTIVCPDDVEEVNDPGQCSAVIPDLPPVQTNDNCPNNFITYEATDENGDILFCGFENAGGNIFPVGNTTVKYTIGDQSLLLITEIVQDGGTTGIEITNFGPSSMDITCGQVAVYDENGMQVDSFLIHTPNNKSTQLVQVDFPPLPTVWESPSPNNLSVGETWTYTFMNNVPFGAEATYEFKFIDRLIDAITVNDEVTAAVFLRETVCDHDLQTDFIPATPCDPGSFGMLNPGLPTMTPNGLQSSLQTFDANETTCTFDVIVEDIEAPTCIMHDSVSINANLMAPIPVPAMACVTSDIVMPDGIVNDVNIHNLIINTLNVGDLTVYLNSPLGTRILLFDGLCETEADVNVTLDDTDGLMIAPNIITAPCGPLGNGGVYAPEEPFKTFFGEPSGGIWQLEMYTSNQTTAEIVNWELEVLQEEPYAQQDTIMTNDTLLCSAEFTWTHPVFKDNCCDGEMTVEYAFVNDVTGISYTENDVIQSFDLSINLDGTLITKVFEVGTTTITYTLVDQYGNQSQCGFKVIVNDTENPRFPFSCPDVYISLDAGECFGAIKTIPEILDNCELDTITFCDSNGDPIDIFMLPIGQNEITIKGIDIYGNVGTCVFYANVIEFVPADDVLNCNNSINLSLDNNCSATVTVDMILEGGGYRCYDNYCISIKDIFGNEHPNIFDLTDVGQQFEVTITDCLGSNNSCWGYVNIEEKLIPQILCPPDTVLYCNVDPEERDNFGRLKTGELIVLSCEPAADISYQDHLNNHGDCSDPRAELVRRWKLIDESGNTVFCDQTITFINYDPQQVVWPEDFFGPDAISCGDILKDPDLTKPVYTGHPTISGLPIIGKNFCDVNVGYEDLILQDANCESGYEILRSWYIRNECAPLAPGINPLVHIQSIKVNDMNPPVLLPVDDLTVSTDPWDCKGKIRLPEIVHDDDCSSYETSWYSSYGKVVGDTMLTKLIKGRTLVTGFVTDQCGNHVQKSFNVTVLDKSAPIVVLKKDVVVGISTSGINGNGSTKVYTDAFDNFSYDACGPVYTEIRRIDSVACDNIGLNGYNNNNTFDNTGHENDSMYDTDMGQYVKFCCEDLTAIQGDANEDGVIDSLDAGYIKVIIRVWDDANMSGFFGDEVPPFPGMEPQLDNYNEGWAWAKVECKSIPVISCPPADTVKCYWDVAFDPSAGWRKVSEVDLSKSGFATAIGCCGSVEVEFSDAGNLQDCQEGTFVRTFRAGYTSLDGRQEYVQCQQRITVERDDFPVVVTPKNRDFANPSCTFDPSIIDQARPTIVGGPCDVIGEYVTVDTFLFENGVCKKWRITYEYWNWCKQESYGPFTEYALYEDTDDPVIMTCQDTCISVDANCEAVVTLTNAAFDVSECTDNEWIKWVVEIDLWADGTIDAVAATHYTQRNWTLVADPWYGNISVINLPATSSKDSLNQTMAQLSGDQIATVTFPEIIQGKMSNHKVTWKAIDGCHNESGCSYNVMVADKKAPTPYCVNVSTALMQDGSVELWARDFDRGSFDNCSDQIDLFFTFNEMSGAFKDTVITLGGRDYLVNADIPQFFDEDGFVGFDGNGYLTDINGNIIPNATSSNLERYAKGDLQRWNPEFNSSSKIFDCDEFLAQGPNGYEIQMSVWDKKCNHDFCIIYLSLIDNQDGCSGNRIELRGNIFTDAGEPLQGVHMSMQGDINDFTIESDVDGYYTFNIPDYISELTMHASKDDNYMNGISTLDLVLIQRHILGLQYLDTEFKLVSADVNDDRKIRANDLVELRKMILGVTNEFTAPSWRIVDANQVIPMSTPLEYEENTILTSFNTPVTRVDFVGTKVGDVSGDASAQFNQSIPANRNAHKITLEIEDQFVNQGQSVVVPVLAREFNNVFGYQFTMDYAGLTFQRVTGNEIEISQENIAIHENSRMTCAWYHKEGLTIDNNVLFYMEFNAEKAGWLSDMISINSDITRAESYAGVNNTITVGDIKLAFDSDKSTIANILYQNEPNPFKGKTTIAFELAQSGSATITFFDLTGKLLNTVTLNGNKGLNSFEVFSKDIGEGLVYYQLTSGDFTATKKMLIVK